MSSPLQDGPAPVGPSSVSSGSVSSGTGKEAEQIATAVSAVPGVAALSGGRLGGVGTYLPGRRVTGVVLREDDLEVHVVGRYGVPVAEIAAEVRQAAEPYVGDRTVHVIIEDLA
jgi:uncharacterized alkaline shock family protein YloU